MPLICIVSKAQGHVNETRNGKICREMRSPVKARILRLNLCSGQNVRCGILDGGASEKNVLARLLGILLKRICQKSLVSTSAMTVEALEESRPKAPTKKNSLFFMIGPPNVPPNSFLRKAGMGLQPTASGAQYWNSVRAVKLLLVKYSDAVPWKSLVPGLVKT